MKNKLAIWSFILSLSVGLIYFLLNLFILSAYARAIFSTGDVFRTFTKTIIFIMTPIIIILFILFIASIVMAIMALQNLKRNKTLEGKKLAITTLIIDGVYALFVILGIVSKLYLATYIQ